MSIVLSACSCCDGYVVCCDECGLASSKCSDVDESGAIGHARKKGYVTIPGKKVSDAFSWLCPECWLFEFNVDGSKRKKVNYQ